MRPIEDALMDTLPVVAVRFFVLFSRFEYALKREGYLIGQGLAEPNWDRFANDLASAFFTEVRASGKCNELIGAPPKKQVAVDGRLEWEPVAAVTTFLNSSFLFVVLEITFSTAASSQTAWSPVPSAIKGFLESRYGCLRRPLSETSG